MRELEVVIDPKEAATYLLNPKGHGGHHRRATQAGLEGRRVGRARFQHKREDSEGSDGVKHQCRSKIDIHVTRRHTNGHSNPAHRHTSRRTCGAYHGIAPPYVREAVPWISVLLAPTPPSEARFGNPARQGPFRVHPRARCIPAAKPGRASLK